MKKKLLSIILCSSLAFSLTGCEATRNIDEVLATNATADEIAMSGTSGDNDEIPDSQDDTYIDLEDEALEAEDTTQASENSVDEALAADSTVSDDNADYVTITVPEEYLNGLTQTQLTEVQKEKGFKSITVNDDGSATYVMTKVQQQESLADISEAVDDSLIDLIGSSSYPNMISIEKNDDYTEFTITTKSKTIDDNESMCVIAIYTYAGMYSYFTGENNPTIHIMFKNAKSEEIIAESYSTDFGTIKDILSYNKPIDDSDETDSDSDEVSDNTAT